MKRMVVLLAMLGLAVLVCGVILLPIVSSAQTSGLSVSYSFTTIDFPGGSRTRSVGINDRGDIVGDYFDSAGVQHGYLLSNGTFTTFDPPGSIQTRSNSINNLGVIGGHFLDSNSL